MSEWILLPLVVNVVRLVGATSRLRNVRGGSWGGSHSPFGCHMCCELSELTRMSADLLLEAPYVLETRNSLAGQCRVCWESLLSSYRTGDLSLAAVCSSSSTSFPIPELHRRGKEGTSSLQWCSGSTLTSQQLWSPGAEHCCYHSSPELQSTHWPSGSQQGIAATLFGCVLYVQWAIFTGGCCTAGGGVITPPSLPICIPPA